MNILKKDLSPIDSSGSFHLTHEIKYKDNHLLLSPSLKSKTIVYLFLILGFLVNIYSFYFLFIQHDLIGFISLLIGGISLLVLSFLSVKNFKIYTFKKRSLVISKKQINVENTKSIIEKLSIYLKILILPRTVKNIEESIIYDDIERVEVIKKTISSRTNTPFKSGEIRILINSGERILVMTGGDHNKMLKISEDIASFMNKNLAIDDRINKI